MPPKASGSALPDSRGELEPAAPRPASSPAHQSLRQTLSRRGTFSRMESVSARPGRHPRTRAELTPRVRARRPHHDPAERRHVLHRVHEREPPSPSRPSCRAPRRVARARRCTRPGVDHLPAPQLYTVSYNYCTSSRMNTAGINETMGIGGSGRSESSTAAGLWWGEERVAIGTAVAQDDGAGDADRAWDCYGRVTDCFLGLVRRRGEPHGRGSVQAPPHLLREAPRDRPSRAPAPSSFFRTTC